MSTLKGSLIFNITYQGLILDMTYIGLQETKYGRIPMLSQLLGSYCLAVFLVTMLSVNILPGLVLLRDKGFIGWKTGLQP